MTRILLALLLLATSVGAAVDVTRYDIEATVLPDSVEAKVRLAATADRTPMQWDLQLSRLMEIRSLSVNGFEVQATRDGDRLVLDLGKLPKDSKTLTLEAVVAGSPRGGGQGRKSTRISPAHARIRGQNPWYPRAAGDAAAYRTVVHARTDWSVRTAGAEKSVKANGGMRTWTYEQEMPVHEIGLVAGPYEVTKLDSEGDVVFDAWTLPGDEGAAMGILEVAKDALQRYGEWFGKVKLDRYSILEMPAEYGTLSGYGEVGYILLGKGAFVRGAEDPVTVALIVHEVAHAWWGQEVRFGHFAHESLASYATLRYLQSTRGEREPLVERERAVRSVVSLARKGGEVALADIREYGRGLDPAIYQGHAYDKGMMILAMVEDALGTKAMDRQIAGFYEASRGTVVEWADLRSALAKGGSAGKTVLAQWEVVGIPTLVVEHTAKEVGRKWKVSGTVTQTGTAKPFRMKVNVVAICGDERAEKSIDLKRANASFSLTTSKRPETVVLDPGWRLLVDAPRAEFDADKAWKRAYDIVSNPGNGDPAECKDAIALLRRCIDHGAGSRESLCWAGIGRCQFRLALNEEARSSLEKALSMGLSPHHRGWANLRLGNLADLVKEREKALGYYRAVTAPGSRASPGARERAEQNIKTPFRRR